LKAIEKKNSETEEKERYVEDIVERQWKVHEELEC
jgi:hypothetical protein